MKKDILESEQFYNLMQAYRHGNRTDQVKILKAFEEVKKFLRTHQTEIFNNCDCVHMIGRDTIGTQVCNYREGNICPYTSIGGFRNCKKYRND
jgi:hypothetical protein